MNVPVGNQMLCRFYFSARELSVKEDEKFLDPDRATFPGLPPDVGFTPAEVLFEYAPPGGTWTLAPGESVVEDATGEYHAIVLVPMDGAGVWQYRGRGVDGSTPVCSTPVRTFIAS